MLSSRILAHDHGGKPDASEQISTGLLSKDITVAFILVEKGGELFSPGVR